MKWMFILLFTMTASAAYATPWLCTNAYGNKEFRYDPAAATDKHCVDHPIPSTSYVRLQPSGASRAHQGAGDFPRVSRQTQKQRDVVRRQILERELAEENRLLAAASSELAAQKQMRARNENNQARLEERLKPYEDRVRHHVTNISNLEKELRQKS